MIYKCIIPDFLMELFCLLYSVYFHESFGAGHGNTTTFRRSFVVSVPAGRAYTIDLRQIVNHVII